MVSCPYCENPFPAMQSMLDRSEIHPCAKCRNPVILTARTTETMAEPIAGVRDIREECPPDSVGGMILSVLHKSRYQLPLLPVVAEQLAKDLSASDEIPAIALRDPILVANMLRAANGDLFGGLERVGSVIAATERLGTERARDLLGTLAEGEPFSMAEPLVAERIQRTWQGSVFAGCAARELAHSQGVPAQAENFAIGLLHDIGKFLIYDAIESGVGESVAAIRTAPQLLDDTVARFHHLCSLHLADRWRFPVSIATSAFAYENVDLANDDALRHATHIAAFAHDLARSTGYGSTGPAEIPLLAHSSNRYLRTTDVEIARIRVDVMDELSDAFSKWEIEPVPKIA